MRYFSPLTFLFGLAIVAACTGNGGTGTKSVNVKAPRPPAEYTYLGSGDLTKSGGVNAIVDFDAPKGDSTVLPVMLAVALAHAMHESTAPAPSHSGSGSRASDPIMFPTVPSDNEVDASGAYLTEFYPGSKSAIGHLFRGPREIYLLWVEFKTASGSNAIYFDVSRWVAARKSFM
ncbi:hypothetical protein [Dongia sp.]|uniref:hypothetical protein n=1 Tax=Dongia sp. TaxID=1977262 RepID=UPI0035B08054